VLVGRALSCAGLTPLRSCCLFGKLSRYERLKFGESKVATLCCIGAFGDAVHYYLILHDGFAYHNQKIETAPPMMFSTWENGGGSVDLENTPSSRNSSRRFETKVMTGVQMANRRA